MHLRDQITSFLRRFYERPCFLFTYTAIISIHILSSCFGRLMGLKSLFRSVLCVCIRLARSFIPHTWDNLFFSFLGLNGVHSKQLYGVFVFNSRESWTRTRTRTYFGHQFQKKPQKKVLGASLELSDHPFFH